MKPRTAKRVGLALMAVSAVVVGVALTALTRTLEDRNVTTVRYIGSVDEARWEFMGHVGEVERLDEPTPDGEEGVLRVHWRGQRADFPIPFSDNPAEAGLRVYQDWFGVMFLVDGEEDEASFKEAWTGGGTGEPRKVPRLVVAGRYPAEGFDKGSWGLVRRQEWQYRIAELRPDGPAAGSIDFHKKSYEELDALFLPGKYTEEAYILPEDERRERMWMYGAMQQVTPPAQYRGRNKASVDVVTSMGWAWPVAVAGVLGLMVGGMLYASARVRRW